MSDPVDAIATGAGDRPSGEGAASEPTAGGDANGSLDVREYLARAENLDEADLTNLLCEDQVRRWLAGERIPAEAYLSLHPSLKNDDEAAFELVYAEFTLRESLGEAPTVQEFLWRFPQFASRLRGQLEFHRILWAAEEATLSDANRPSQGEQTDSGPETVVPGPVLPGYRIVGELGHGGMGVVYKARQERLKRMVALKVIRAGATFGSEAASRFRAEAEVAARFQHPNIIQVFEVGEHDGLGYLALEYAAGGSLQQKLAGTPRAPGESARMVQDLAQAVHYAHERGIVHRDLKPANVVLTEDGVPKITDFGLAKLLEIEEGPTHSEAILGTPSYMAPEQARGGSRQITRATDVYALGAILYEMLTGRPPFKGATPLSTLEQVSSQEPLSPGKFQRHMPRDLEVICLKCLEKEPRRRYASALELAEDLQRFLDSRPILARPAPAWEKAWKWARRRPSTATALAVSVAALGIVLAGALYYNARLGAAMKKSQTAERKAVEQRNLAMKALNHLVYGVQEKLGEAPATRGARRALLDTAIAGLDEIARSAEASPPDLSRAVAHQKLGEIFRQIGRAADARRQLMMACGLAEDLASASPQDVAIAECLRASYLGLGELSLRASQFGDSKNEFGRAVQLAESIAIYAPQRDGTNRMLLEAYLQLGRAHGFAGELPEAEKWFLKTQDLAERWATAEPGNTQAKEMLAWSYRKLADMKKLSKDLPGARGDYLEAIAIGRKILKVDPGNVESKTHLGIALDDLAGIVHRMQELGEARATYSEAEQIFTELVEADPENAEMQQRLIRSQTQFARLVKEEHKFPEAAEILSRIFDRERRLEREGRQSVTHEHIQALQEEIADCRAAPTALADLEIIRARPTLEACQLLLIRGRLQTSLRRESDVIETGNALAALEADQPKDLYSLAHSLGQFIGSIEESRWANRPSPERTALRGRCALRAVAALDQAASRGFDNLPLMEADTALSPIREHPGYLDLLNRIRASSPGSRVRREQAR